MFLQIFIYFQLEFPPVVVSQQQFHPKMREKENSRAESGNFIASFIALGVIFNRIQSSANFALGFVR